MLILGIDCATDERKVGLARGTIANGDLKITDLALASVQRASAEIAANWIAEAGSDALIALDAPLGWPAKMGELLAGHQAGQLIDCEPNIFFRRETDRFVQTHLRLTPLDVGADRIARTAHAGLTVLNRLRLTLNMPIPLAWTHETAGTQAIEVYPAATLLAHGLLARGYKRPDQRQAREGLLRLLQEEIRLEVSPDLLLDDANALDAVGCVLAGKDFLSGLAKPPLDLALARREGWIWVAPLGQGERASPRHAR